MYSVVNKAAYFLSSPPGTFHNRETVVRQLYLQNNNGVCRQENPETAMTAMTLLGVLSFTTCFFKFCFPLNLDLLTTDDNYGANRTTSGF